LVDSSGGKEGQISKLKRGSPGRQSNTTKEVLPKEESGAGGKSTRGERIDGNRPNREERKRRTVVYAKECEGDQRKRVLVRHKKGKEKDLRLKRESSYTYVSQKVPRGQERPGSGMGFKR